jgi:hypothetical protein
VSAARQQDWDYGDVHTPEDDLESFVHVITWLCLRYLETNLHPEDQLPDFLRDMYDLRIKRPTSAAISGGVYPKLQYFLGDIASFSMPGVEELAVIGNFPLSVLLEELQELFKPRYTPLLRPKQDRHAAIRAATFGTPAPITAPTRSPVEASALLQEFDKSLAEPGWPDAVPAKDRLPVNQQTGFWFAGLARQSHYSGLSMISSVSRAASTSSKRPHSDITPAEAANEDGGSPSSPTPRDHSPPPRKAARLSPTSDAGQAAAFSASHAVLAGTDEVPPRAGPSRRLSRASELDASAAGPSAGEAGSNASHGSG